MLASQTFRPKTPGPQVCPHALKGVRVVDFSHFLAGPLATMILADMGAALGENAARLFGLRELSGHYSPG
jgi:hypothetical protein